MIRPMRIMYLTESMGWSGGAQQVLWMSQKLSSRGHDLVLACQPGSEIMTRAQAAGLPTLPVRMRQDYDLPAALHTAALLKEHQIEVLHAQHSTAHAIGLMAVAFSRKPVFAVTRRVMFPLRRNPFSRLKYLSSRIDGYVAISEAVRRELEVAGIAAPRIEVIPSVIEIHAESKDEGAKVREEFGISPTAAVVLSVGNYADFKGQDHLIRAAAGVVKRHPQVRVLLAGRDIEKAAPLVESLGLSKVVVLAGFRRDVPRLLAAADLFVMPSLQEAVATALREAMAVGLPCVGSNVGGIPESIVEGQTGLLVPPAQPAALARAISRLLDQPEEARRLGLAGKAMADALWAVEPAAARLETFYERLLQKAPQAEAAA